MTASLSNECRLKGARKNSAGTLFYNLTLHHLFELKILLTILGGQIVWTLGTIWNLLYRETTIPISECDGAVHCSALKPGQTKEMGLQCSVAIYQNTLLLFRDVLNIFLTKRGRWRFIQSPKTKSWHVHYQGFWTWPSPKSTACIRATFLTWRITAAAISRRSSDLRQREQTGIGVLGPMVLACLLKWWAYIMFVGSDTASGTLGKCTFFEDISSLHQKHLGNLGNTGIFEALDPNLHKSTVSEPLYWPGGHSKDC